MTNNPLAPSPPGGASLETEIETIQGQSSVVATAPASALVNRLGSLDAYRGLVMLLMMAEVMKFWRVREALPDSALWKSLAHHQSHAEWIGCSLHDLIQPSFSFLVGAALPFSLARRAADGQPHWPRRL